MEDVRVDKKSLMAILVKNRDEHRQIFLEALDKYLVLMTKILEDQVAAIRQNKQFAVYQITSVIAPEDHTSDYNRVIKMLEMSVDETVVIDRHEFANFVEDVWDWSRRWAAGASNYVQNPKLASLSGSH